MLFSSGGATSSLYANEHKVSAGADQRIPRSCERPANACHSDVERSVLQSPTGGLGRTLQRLPGRLCPQDRRNADLGVRRRRALKLMADARVRLSSECSRKCGTRSVHASRCGRSNRENFPRPSPDWKPPRRLRQRELVCRTICGRSRSRKRPQTDAKSASPPSAREAQNVDYSGSRRLNARVLTMIRRPALARSSPKGRHPERQVQPYVRTIATSDGIRASPGLLRAGRCPALRACQWLDEIADKRRIS
jgi:hypothetical protein